MAVVSERLLSHLKRSSASFSGASGARRAGEVVGKAEILDNVWDFAFEGDPNIVEVYIPHSRRKLDEPFRRHPIETVRGVGYRLDARRGSDR